MVYIAKNIIEILKLWFYALWQKWKHYNLTLINKVANYYMNMTIQSVNIYFKKSYSQ